MRYERLDNKENFGVIMESLGKERAACGSARTGCNEPLRMGFGCDVQEFSASSPSCARHRDLKPSRRGFSFSGRLATIQHVADSHVTCRKKSYTGHNPAPARINSFPSNGVNSKIARYAKGSKPGTQKRECAGWTDWPPIAPDRAKQADKVPYSGWME